MTSVGAVIIGRNEGARLLTCLTSVCRQLDTVVYVDSGSRDGSVAAARMHGALVVELDRTSGFTAARARNAGFDRLKAALPDVQFVQFIDGDCELAESWLEHSLAFLRARPRAAIACGRRRERHPDASPYNRLCDHEWDTPIGVAATCGGDALVRATAFESAGGFSPALIAGEEPELCHRIRAQGWTIHRLPMEMTTHDAAMTRFAQWWQRNRRSGYAFAEAFAQRGRGNRAMLRTVVSNVVWSLPLTWPLWPILWVRIARRRGPLYATFVTIGKIPHCHGQLDYWRHHRELIEYK